MSIPKTKRRAVRGGAAAQGKRRSSDVAPVLAKSRTRKGAAPVANAKRSGGDQTSLVTGRRASRGGPLPAPIRRALAWRLNGPQNSYDAARDRDSSLRHWQWADSLSADSANSAAVRLKLRNRSRYEVANNGWAKGIVLTLANDLIGPGPRLQMLTDDADLNRLLEREFASWSRRVNLASRLRVLHQARVVDGEGFGTFINNPRLAHAVHLDLRLVEAEQVAAPASSLLDATNIDGIQLDEFGNPVSYSVRRQHPGDATGLGAWQYDTVPAAYMVHWFRPDRAGQHRGVPDLTSSLEGFAQLRRYRLSVLDAAETAANLAGVMTTNLPPPNDEGTQVADEVPPLAVFDIERNTFVTAPMGWDAHQIKAEQPAANHTEFCDSVLNEIARPVGTPFNLAKCNSSSYSWAGASLDLRIYWRSIVEVNRAALEEAVVDRVLGAWLIEAATAIPGAESLAEMLVAAADASDVPHMWFWQGCADIDEVKAADAQAVRLENHTTTLAAEYATQRKDWEVELRQRAKEVALMKELNLTPAQARPRPAVAATDEEGVPERPGRPVRPEREN